MKLQTGSVLVSEPFLPDPNFRRTVVFLAEYSENGSVGYVLNHKTDLSVNVIISELDFVHNTIYQGGPVELESFHYIHAYGHLADTTHIKGEIFWGGNFNDFVRGLNNGSLSAKNCMFFVGYSGWAPGQLEAEVAEGSWIITELDDNLILNPPMEDNELWKKAVKSAGGSDSLLFNSPEEPNLN